MLEAFGVSAGIVFLAEIGDKTQILTLFLAARFARKHAVIAGMVVATFVNHIVSAMFGAWMNRLITPSTMLWVTGVAFIMVGLWLLIPDRDNDEHRLRRGAFVSTLILFFLAEIGDKTQIATVLLAAKYHSLWMVTAGSVLGLLAANIPVIFLGEKCLRVIPLKIIRFAACAAFCLLGAWTIRLALLGSFA